MEDSILPSRNFCSMDPITCWRHLGSLSNALHGVTGKLSASRFGSTTVGERMLVNCALRHAKLPSHWVSLPV
jgi:hypothetical protein